MYPAARRRSRASTSPISSFITSSAGRWSRLPTTFLLAAVMRWRGPSGEMPWVSRVASFTRSLNSTPDSPPLTTPSLICALAPSELDSPPTTKPLAKRALSPSISSWTRLLAGSPCTTPKYAPLSGCASMSCGVRSGGSMLKSLVANSPSITAIAGCCRYSAPVAHTPTPMLPVQCGTAVALLKNARIASSSPAKASETYRKPSVADAGIAPNWFMQACAAWVQSACAAWANLNGVVMAVERSSMGTILCETRFQVPSHAGNFCAPPADHPLRQRHAGNGRRPPHLLGNLRQSRRRPGAVRARRPRLRHLAQPAPLLRSGALPHRPVRPARLRPLDPARRTRRQHHAAPDRRHGGAAARTRRRHMAGVRRLVGLDAGARLRRGPPRALPGAGAARHLPVQEERDRLVPLRHPRLLPRGAAATGGVHSGARTRRPAGRLSPSPARPRRRGAPAGRP